MKTISGRIKALYDEHDQAGDRVLAEVFVQEAPAQLDQAEEEEDADRRLAHFRAARSFLEEAEHRLTRRKKDSRI